MAAHVEPPVLASTKLANGETVYVELSPEGQRRMSVEKGTIVQLFNSDVAERHRNDKGIKWMSLNRLERLRMEENIDNPINAALRSFEAAEANLEKLERVFKELRGLVPDDICIGSEPQYEELCRVYDDVLDALPKIDGWKPESRPIDLNALAQLRLGAREVDEIDAIVEGEEVIDGPARQLADYRHRLSKKRRQLVRRALSEVIGTIDDNMRPLGVRFPDDAECASKVDDPAWEELKRHVQEIEILLGSSLPRPARWNDLRRHLHFGKVGDLLDIIKMDWPAVKAGLSAGLYDRNEPVPVDVDDLGVLAAANPKGMVSTRLKWDALSAEDFERVVFALISEAKGYKNPQWLTRTNAPDRGRDLSATRIADDQLAGVIESRVIIQCKHWLKKSVAVSDVAELREQMVMWAPPQVDVLVIATTGRFSSDAVSMIEKHNNADRALRIEMWPESHLERLLAQRPSVIADFGLR